MSDYPYMKALTEVFISRILIGRGDDWTALALGYDLDLCGLVGEMLERGMDAMLTDLELSEGRD